MKTDIKSLSYDELCEFISSVGLASYRAKQIFEWLARGASGFDEMTNISKADRAKLEEGAYIDRLLLSSKLLSDSDGTVKYLFELKDGQKIETALMRYKHGNTVCLSTQAGCKMGCAFCASAIGGFVRNLTPAEMLNQVIFVSNDLGIRVDNIVLMGIGEPLDNLDNVLKFIYNVNDKNGLNIGMRHISLSTCGLVPGIKKLSEHNLQITLSVSLHAADNQCRNSIMPVNKRYDIDCLISACRDYIKKTGRRISFEYAIIKGQNDSREAALKLCTLLRGLNCHVNVIPVNRVEEKNFAPPERENVEKFCKILTGNRIPVTVRRKLGGDINASCGQLRRSSAG